jgi:hypothetical protein
MIHTIHRHPTTTPGAAPRELRLADLAAAATTFSSSDPGPDPFFDEDPIPEIAAVR